MSHPHPHDPDPVDVNERPSDHPPKTAGVPRWVKLGAAGFGVFLLGVACGGVTGDEGGADPTAAPAPTVTVTRDVPGPEIPVGVTPQACIDAVEAADEAFATSSQVLEIQAGLFSDEVPRAVLAAADGDVTALEEASADMEEHAAEVTALAATLEADKYQAAKAQCLAGGTE